MRFIFDVEWVRRVGKEVVMSSLPSDANEDRRAVDTGQGEKMPPREPDELTDEELEWVVGGTDPQYATSQFEQLQRPASNSKG